MVLKFKQRKEYFTSLAKSLSLKLIYLRIVFFIFILIFLWFHIYMANNTKTTYFEFLGFFSIVTILVILARLHSYFSNQQKWYVFLAEVNSDEIDILEKNIKNIYGGENFIDKSHPYAVDLDFFGDFSIFKFVNRTSLCFSRLKLTEWLLKKADTTQTITDRQMTIKALAQNIDFVQNFIALGKLCLSTTKNIDIAGLFDFLQSKNNIPNIKTIYLCLHLVIFLLSVIFLPNNLLVSASIIFLTINFFILNKLKKSISETFTSFTYYSKIIQTYAKCASSIEKLNISADLINKNKKILLNDSASNQLEKLHNLLKFVEVRKNPLYALLNSVLCIDFWMLKKLSIWKEKNGNLFKPWINAITELDVLNSAAALYIANPHMIFAEITEKESSLSMVDAKHPFIPNEKQVGNSFEMTQKGEICLLTGANMGGKSTLLKSIGVNLVLSLAGFPAFASSIQTSKFSLFTSMKHQDSLQSGESLFYTEIKKIKDILDNISHNSNNIFLFDEILRGTNSDDRYKGSKYIIEKLQKMNATGWVATHDLQLGNLPNITNYSFNSTIKNGKVNFNHSLMNGICNSFTAIDLMKEIGIIDEQI